ncbi:hypothetical protein [Burkholderia multivorans]|uniref:hypothetical protein n=1 Tax=Burkholderia multivorans TaxID=87883 RepID=UPI001120AA6A|nr:hypothetical protein [Burkholderia multivorans]
MYQTLKRACLLFVAVVVCLATSSRALHIFPPASNIKREAPGYQTLNVGAGIQLSIPSNWIVTSEAQKDQIRADLERFIGNEGSAETASPLLFQAVSGPGWEVEAITINVKTSASVKPSDIRRVAGQLPQVLPGEIEKSLQGLLQHVGNRVTKFDGTKVRDLDGYPAAVSSYEYARGTRRKYGRLTIVHE